MILYAALLNQSCQGQQQQPTCTVNSDCVVKDVGNCCGYYPKCVHYMHYPDPAAVKKACEENGMGSACGWIVIDACACNSAGRCINLETND